MRGVPVEGVRVQLSGKMTNPSDEYGMTLTEITDSNGIAKFGPVQPGKYDFEVYSKWKQNTHGELVVLPGPSTTETVICPSGPPTKATTHFDVIWPDAMKDAFKGRDMWVQCSFSQIDMKFAGRFWADSELFIVTVTSQHEILQGLETYHGFRSVGWASYPLETTATAIDLKQFERTRQVEWPIGEYVLTNVVLLIHSTQSSDPTQEFVQPIYERSFYRSEHPALKLQASKENQWAIRLPMMNLPIQILWN